jgi:hypothetical protein
MATPHLLPEHDLWEAYGYQASVGIDRNFRLTGDGISHGGGRWRHLLRDTCAAGGDPVLTS